MLIFSGDEEHTLHQKLESLCSEAKHVANEGGLYTRSGKKKGLSKISKDETKSKLNTREIEEIISGGLEFLDDDEATDDANSYVNDITKSEPHDDYKIGEVCWIKIWFKEDSRDAKYLYIDNKDLRDLKIVINESHPSYIKLLSESTDVQKKAYVQNCIYDAVAECMLVKNQDKREINPHSFRSIKDKFLRYDATRN